MRATFCNFAEEREMIQLVLINLRKHGVLRFRGLS